MLLIIGVHREELAFGDAVAARLDPARFAVLRIPEGLSGERPGPEALERYRRAHGDLYRQILDHVEPAHRVLMDLHTGIDENHRSADVLCAHEAPLRCIERDRRALGPLAGSSVRGVRLAADGPVSAPPDSTGAGGGREPARRWPILRPEIPEAIWRSTDPLYLGLEVYLPRAGDGSQQDAAFAATLCERLAACALPAAEARRRSR